ncbi:MAG: fatty acid--CoA ligase family protein [Desulfobacterales bacterium]|nr:fatty acid--CoA ligase family protein [Desulfobacterales bacterium]
MKFINQNTAVSDGDDTCRFSDIAGHFESIKKVFHRNFVGRDDPVVLSCSNSLPGALTLLYLLEEGYNFLLIGMEPDDGAGYFPCFCRYKIVAGYGEKKGERTGADDYLRIIENYDHVPADLTGETGPKLLLRTSGSTGVPKMAVHSHTMLKGNAGNCITRLGLGENSRIAIPVPITHMYGLGAAFLPGMLAGAAVDLQAGANLLRFIQRETVFNPDTAFMTPVFCETLLKGRRSSRKYKLTVTAGDRFRNKESFERYESLFGPLVNLYGSTEMGAMTAASADEPISVRSEAAGNPMDGVLIRTEKKEAVKGEGMRSMLWCKHPYGFGGYIDESGIPLGECVRENDGWFCTKDLGEVLPGGSIRVFGRNDHSVNRDGLLVSFADVESGLQQISGIDSAIVVAKGESRRGKRLIACIIPEKGADTDESRVRASCFDLLPNRAVPDEIRFLKSLPLLASGKVDRQRLEVMVQD